MDPICGGHSGSMDATEEIQRICDQVKSKVEAQTNEKYVVFKAVEYSEQCVAGTNYIIKVHAGGTKYIHLRLFKELGCDGGGVHLHGVQQHKTRDDPLKSFSTPVLELTQISNS